MADKPDDKDPSPTKPSNSTFAGLLIGVPIATVLAWTLHQWMNVDVPGEVQSAFGAIVSTVVGYFFSGGRNADTK